MKNAFVSQNVSSLQELGEYCLFNNSLQICNIFSVAKKMQLFSFVKRNLFEQFYSPVVSFTHHFLI